MVDDGMLKTITSKTEQRVTLLQRTSLTHPLAIAEVPVPGGGAIGVTFCPGKKQPFAASGAWDRDLDLDLDRIHEWGAHAVVSLIEDHEFDQLSVRGLGDAVRNRFMTWYHLPITDVSVPTDRFEKDWIQSGEALRAMLREGFKVVIHCKGGLGRAGTIAARLLAELGTPPHLAIEAVRAVRPGAIETDAQFRHVVNTVPVPEPTPDTSASAVRDRAVGALLGLALGDALGTTLEFRARDSYAPIVGIAGGGPFGLAAGQWTDDTAMALALADSLTAKAALDERDLAERFLAWHERGEYSCTGTCFDIGITTREALGRFRRTGNPLAGSTDPMSAGNGSLMRLAPVAIRYFDDRAALRDVAARQSRTTHGAPEAVDACVAYAEMLADAIAGAPRSAVLRPTLVPTTDAIAAIIAGSWRGKPRAAIRSSGYVAHSLEAALWSVGQGCDFAAATLHAANLGDDADTTAAIAGQLAGAFAGKSGLPAAWLNILAWRPRIEVMALACLPPQLED